MLQRSVYQEGNFEVGEKQVTIVTDNRKEIGDELACNKYSAVGHRRK